MDWTLRLVALLPIYLILVASLRFHRAKRMARPFTHPPKRPLSSMTLDEAHAILKDLFELEFPKAMVLSMISALFKVGALH